jgi:lactoylglutathione lyase
MKLLRKRDVPEEKYTNAFLGFGPEDTNFALELTCSMMCSLTCQFFVCGTVFIFSSLTSYKLINSCSTDYGIDKYDIGEGFGHFGIANEDVISIANLQCLLSASAAELCLYI